MNPDASRHDPRPEYLRALLSEAGLPQREAARRIGISERLMRYYLAPETAEARVVQDADRLDALGAVGIARCLMLGATMGRPLYDPDEPFPLRRPPDDAVSSLDHFFTKLLRLAGTMTTAAGRAEAERRTETLRGYLRELASNAAGHSIVGRPCRT